MKKTILASVLGVLFVMAWLPVKSVLAAEPPVGVAIAEGMHRLPSPLNVVNWKQDAIDYYRLMFDPNAVGANLPAVAVSGGTAFGFKGYLTEPAEISGECELNLSAVIAAEGLGFSMTNLYGYNWVQMGKNWFNSNAGMYRLRPWDNGGQLDGGIYGIWPMALGYMFADRHTNDPAIRSQMASQSAVVLTIANLYGAPNNLNFDPNWSYDAGTRTLVPPTYTVTPMMGAAANFGWQLMMGYQWTGDTNYLASARAFLQWQLDRPARTECVSQHGPIAVARMNAQYGYNLDLARMMDSFYGDGNRMPGWSKPQWGLTTAVNTGGLDCDGLDADVSPDRQPIIGWTSFAMGTFENAAWLAPVARYDQRFAHSIGRTLLNLANSARYLRGINLDWSHQDHKDWRDALPNPAWRTNTLPYQGAGYLFPSEKLENTSRNADVGGVYYSPYDTGDNYNNPKYPFGGGTNYYYNKVNPPLHFSTNAQNIAPYMGNHVGFLGLVYNQTDVPAIPVWDLLVTDYSHPAAYPSYLFYNPYYTATNVNFNFGTNVDLYDAVSGVFLKRGVTGTQTITMGADQAMVLVCAPAGGTVTYSGGQMLVNGTVIDYRSSGTNGFRAEYCNNTSVDNPSLTRFDPQLNFNWGGGTPDASITNSNFSVRWTGSVVPKYSETYTLTTVSSNSLRLWVNGQLAVNNWATAQATNTASVALTANQPVDVRVELARNPQLPPPGPSLSSSLSSPTTIFAGWHNQITNGSVSIYGTTIDNNYSVLLTQNGTGGQSGSAVFRDLNPGKSIAAFSSSFAVNLNGDIANHADGYSFNFTPLNGGQGLFGEVGASSGFAISVPTYNFGTHDVIYVKWNGATIASQSASTWQSWTTWNVSVDALGNFSVQFGANPAITGNISGWPSTDKTGWQFVFAGRDGGATETAEIGNTTINTFIASLAVAINPGSQTVYSGSPASFTATSSGGSGSYAYQWYQNGTNLVGQMGATLNLSNVLTAMSGYSYSVNVSDGSTNLNSPAAILTVVPNQAQAQVALYWSSPSQAQQLIPAANASPARGYGLQGEYYSDNNLANLALVRPDAAVNFNWGAGTPDSLLPANSPWSARWTGSVVAGLSDTYTFTVNSGGGARLYLDGQLVINNWNASGPTTSTCQASLWTGQPVQVRLECNGNAGNGQAQLSWVSASQPQTEIIPASRWKLNSAAPAPPVTPGGLVSRVNRTQVLLTWNAVPGATTYKVYRALSSGGPTNLIAVVGTTSYVDSNLTEGTSYVYFVSADNAGGESGSASVTATPIVSSAPYTLDKLLLGQSHAAYSLKLLAAGYTGPALQVRRDSDNATVNIGFTSNGNLDTAALLNFVGGANGYASIWYDQSGNGINVSQGTATNQPQLVAAGVINKVNGYPALSFNGSQSLFVGGQNWQAYNPFTYSVVAQAPSFNAGGTQRALVSFSTAGWLMFNGSSTSLDFGSWGDDSYYTVTSDQALHVWTAVKPVGAGSSLFVDDVLVGNNGTPNNLMAGGLPLYIGSANAGAWGFVGNLPEAIIFSSTLSGPDLDTLATSQSRNYTWPTVSPLAGQTVLVGSNVVINASAFGPGTLNYQWQFQGTNLASQTSASLSLPNIQTNQAGAYTVIVSNAYGSVLSSPAQINVLLGWPPASSIQPVAAQVLAGYTATFTTTATGSGTLRYQWYLNGHPLFGAQYTNPTLTITNCSTGASAGTYSVLVYSAYGAVTNQATLTVLPAALNQMGATAHAAYALRLLRTNYTGFVVQVRRDSDNSTANIGIAPNGYLDTAALLNFVGAGNGYVTVWYDQSGSGVNVTQATAASQPQLVFGGVVNTVNGYPSVAFNGSQYLAAGSQSWLVNTPYTYTATCQAQSFNAGGTFRAIASYNNQGWLMFSGSSATLDLGNAGDDSYYTVPSDQALAVLTAVKLSTAGSVLYRNGPAIGTNTTPASLITGPNTFYVGSASAGTWSFVGNISQLAVFTSVLGATDQQLLENNQGAVYAVNISRPPPTVAISPINPAVANGSTVVFSATASSGRGSYTYQWLQNGTNLTGQTGTTLTLNNVTLAMNGYAYQVTVNDGATNVTSAVSTLTVAPADTVLLQDNFSDAPNAGQATFNNHLATTQTGSSLGTIAYSLATENGPGGQASANAWQHGNADKTSGDMLLHGRDNQASAGNPVVFAGLNHNFATDANSANLPLVIEFNIWVTDSDPNNTWESVNIGNTQNAWVNTGGTQFGSLFVPNGSTQQFPQAPNNNGITYNQGDQIRLVLADASGTGSAFNSSGTSVVKMYQNGTLVHTFTGLTLAATDGYVSFQSYFAAGYVAHLSIRLAGAPPQPSLTVSLSAGQIAFHWPVSAYGYNLYTSPLLGASANWTMVSNPLPVVDPGNPSLMLLSLPVTTQTNAFFRLQK